MRDGIDKNNAAVAPPHLIGSDLLHGIPGVIGGVGEHTRALLGDDQVKRAHGQKLIAGVAVKEQGHVVGGENFSGDRLKNNHGRRIALKKALIFAGDFLQARLHLQLVALQRADVVADDQEEQAGGQKDEERPLHDPKKGGLHDAGRQQRQHPFLQQEPEQAEDQVIAGRPQRHAAGAPLLIRGPGRQ